METVQEYEFTLIMHFEIDRMIESSPNLNQPPRILLAPRDQFIMYSLMASAD
jgi:hypothetical protein